MTLSTHSKIIIALSSLSMLVGCKEQVKSIEWYKTHEKERKEKMMKCNSEFKDTPDCNNAKKAQIYLGNEALKEKLQKK